MSACVVLLLVALGLRLSLLIRSGWLLEGDDALSALMALGIMDGDRPIMLKNQTYASAWEPYAMAASFTVLGVSRVAAKLPELVTSMAVIAATWFLASQAARETPMERRAANATDGTLGSAPERAISGRGENTSDGGVAAAFAAGLAAIPPIYVLVLSLKPWAPYTEVILFGTLCLGCAIRAAWHSHARHARRWLLLCGLTGGIAFWMHPLAIWYLSAAALCVLLRVRERRLFEATAYGLLGFLLGALPVWIFNLQTGGATFRFVLNGTQGQTADRGAVLSAWWNADLPRGAGLWHPWGASPSWLSWLMAAVLTGAVAWALLGRRRVGVRPLDIILLFLVLIPTLFVLSGFGGPALNPYGFDATGRYAPPIWTGLAVVLGAACAALWRVRPWLGFALCSVPVAINLAAFVAIEPTAAFQSPYWERLPVDNTPLLTVLRDEHVTDVWINHWAGQPLMFDARAAGQPLIAYDWYDVQAGGIDRFPEYRAIVERASRAAYVLVTDETEPELERVLRQMNVAFVERRVPPYVVVIPTSRTVHPSEVTPALDYRY